MGLDIHAYAGIRATDIALGYDDDGGRHPIDREADGLVWLSRGVADEWDRIHEGAFGARPGYFDGLDDRHYMAFSATGWAYGSSYGTYGAFRRLLDDYVHITEGVPEGAFREMTRFSDCEGTIGPKVCAKLLADFRENEEGFCRWLDEGRVDDWSGLSGRDILDCADALYRRYLAGLELACSDGDGCLVYR